MTALILATCPLCEGEGLGRYPSYGPHMWPCPVCDADGGIAADLVPLFARLRDYMHDVANAMQRGDADEAARLARVAARVAEMLRRSKL